MIYYYRSKEFVLTSAMDTGGPSDGGALALLSFFKI